MNEALLQFIWANNLYNPAGLHSADGEPITVIHSGRLNRDAGPDFSEAKIKVGDTTLVGNVELHVRASEWLKHGHQEDAAYSNLALHVVYDNDMPTGIANVPTVEIKDHISADTLARYSTLMQKNSKLPCSDLHHQIKSITREHWMSRLLAERWEQKLQDWQHLLDQSADDWRNLLYWRLAANFGFKTNAAPFLELARSTPINIVTRHKDNLQQIEALYFGQAGMLDGDFKEDYPRDLQREYDYLRKKYSLKPMHESAWKFLRMRPVNFPSVRIAQFAALIHGSIHLFSHIIESHSVQQVVNLFDVTASSYWNNHYRLDAPHEKPFAKALGKSSVENIAINTVAPIQFLYAAHQGTPLLQEKALHLLESVPAEKNHIITLWADNGWRAANAAQSQALIQLFNQYCTPKRCLECTIGHNIMKSRV